VTWYDGTGQADRASGLAHPLFAAPRPAPAFRSVGCLLGLRGPGVV